MVSWTPWRHMINTGISSHMSQLPDHCNTFWNQCKQGLSYWWNFTQNLLCSSCDIRGCFTLSKLRSLYSTLYHIYSDCIGFFLFNFFCFIYAAVFFFSFWKWLSSPSAWGAPLNCLSVCQAFGQVPEVAARRSSPPRPCLYLICYIRCLTVSCAFRPSYGTKTVLPVFWQGLPQGW